MEEKRRRTKVKEKILQTLQELEQENNVKILFAVEAGSRAWGFASQDSDYDVRFLYVRSKEDYLRLNPMRDVIERPVHDALDVNGWDLRKALCLLYKSNPTLLEWFTSPIVYRKTDFAGQLQDLLPDYFNAEKSFFHYLNMAEGNYQAYLRKDFVRVKKYFYVLRPMLACKWVLEKKTMPPVRFAELAAELLPNELQNTVQDILNLKTQSKEVEEIPKNNVLNDYIQTQLAALRRQGSGKTPKTSKSWSKLNAAFLSVIQ